MTKKIQSKKVQAKGITKAISTIKETLGKKGKIVKAEKTEEKVQSPKESPETEPVRSGVNKLPTGQDKGIAKAILTIKETLGKEGEIIKAEKTEGGWEIEIEVIEQSEYMKRIGIPKPVYDKNVYRVLLNRNFEFISYERKSQKPSGGAAE